MGEAGGDGIQRGQMEVDAVEHAVVLERLHAFGRRGGQVNELPVGVTGEPWVVLLEVAEDGDHHLLAKVLGQVQLALAFAAIECLRRRQQKHGLARGIRLAQRVAPALSGTDAVQVDEHIIFVPAAGHQPALEREGCNIIFARMRNE